MGFIINKGRKYAVKRIRKISALAVASFTLATVLAAAVMAGQTGIKKEVSFKDINKGDVIETGYRNNPDDLCQVSFGITHEFSPGEKGSKSIRTIVDNNCNVIVMEKNESLQPAVDGITIAPGQSTLNADVYMYGWGGKTDKLTERYSKMTIGWNESSAWRISGDNGICWWLPEGWNLNTCAYSWEPDTGDEVNMSSKGDFHWLFERHKHSLVISFSGLKSGHAICSYWYSGSIVSGSKGRCDYI